MMGYTPFLFLFFLSFTSAFLLTPLMRITALKSGIIAVPDDRKVHRQPVPYLGGIAIYCSFMLGVFIVACCWPEVIGAFSERFKGLIIGGTLIVLLGLWDDTKN